MDLWGGRPYCYIRASDLRLIFGTYAKARLAFQHREVSIEGDGDEATKVRGVLSRLYEEYCLHFNGAFRRNHEGYWKDWVVCEFGKVNAKVIVAERDNEAVGYLVYSWREEEKDGHKQLVLGVLEFGVGDTVFKEDGGAAAFVQLLQVAANRKGVTQERFLVNLRTGIEKAFRKHRHAPSTEKEEQHAAIEYQVDKGWMFKVMDPSILDGVDTLVALFGDNFIFWQADKF